MKSRAAVLREAPGTWKIEEVEVADPGPKEVQVKLAAAGLCHSDDHITTGDLPLGHYPVVGGHEGAGVVTAVGPGVTDYRVGDHVTMLCDAGCGICKWCAMGAQNLCDLNAELLGGAAPEDPSRYRIHIGDEAIGQFVAVSTFSEYTTVSLPSVMKLPDDIPLELAALISCGVTTGWGAAVNSIHAEPSQTVIVAGIGGVGINAVQGASHAGASTIIAVDPVEFKRERALALGATHAFATLEEAGAHARGVTNGQGADGTVVTIGVVEPAHVAEAFATIRKGGAVAVTGLGRLLDTTPLPVSLAELTFYQKRLVGSLYGNASPRYTILRLIDLWRSGQLELEELITTRYTLDQVNDGYADLHAGKNLRGVILFD
ncbi:NDMA-dependent alcohol dehydrogenase [Jiangella endophytica]|uniref:NDMA-dependent alcohol dehydrogenase n=1 Tax=Jiangella endophytica TaxID=1623398 RepID=UPI000E34B2CC|nr:NDMA-dependent alcohol dehydrogenase [Jiangella endophytica]